MPHTLLNITFRNGARRLCLLILVVLVTASQYFSSLANADEKELTDNSPEGLDVVLLMDASGSMLNTDPLRLRDQGAKLFLQFLKTGDRLSIVQFAGDAHVLQPLQDYDPAKSADAEATINKVTTDGAYTDLLTGVQAAAEQLQKNGRPNATKLIVLLSDGKMEPNPSVGSSAANTTKLLEDVLPALKQENIKIHTLCFSDQADKDLLAQIAVGTDAVNWFTFNVDKIHESFADLFLVVKKPQVVPLTKKGMLIDGEVTEATFYINRDEGGETSITIPAGKTWTATNKPPEVKWFRSDKFDVVTVADPQPGTWQITGASTDDGFATVLTELKLITDWPNSLRTDDTVLVQARLYDGDKPVSLSEFTGLVRYAFQITPTDQVSEPIMRELLYDDETHGDKKKGDGIFSNTIQLEQEGEYRMRIVARSPTFEREQNIPFRVRPSLLSVSIGEADESMVPHEEEKDHGEDEEGEEHHKEEPKLQVGDKIFKVNLSQEVVGFKNLQISLNAVDEDDHEQELEIQKLGKDGLTYVAAVHGLPHEGKYTVTAKLSAKAKKNEELHVSSKPIEYVFGHVVVHEEAHKTEEEHPAAEEKKPVVVKSKGTPFWMGLMIVTLFNLVSGAVGFFILKKGRTNAAEIVAEYFIPAELSAILAEMNAKVSEGAVNIDDPLFTKKIVKTTVPEAAPEGDPQAQSAEAG